ncbi:MAG TPA: type II toxin-antitoxin system VapC family toxin [Actinomycetota bacterium]|nr:type II toxin-antitoxin system VapC family toxin [Actinomycetota bacterium]
MTADARLPTYVDTSVLVAVLSPGEPHHIAASHWLRGVGDLVTSVVTEVELGRALGRRASPARLRSVASRLLAGCELVEMSDDIRRTAVDLRPASLRTLDALHVATALVAGVGEFATFDIRQKVGAEEAGLTPAALGGQQP